uniref:ribosomal protein S3 n=1 Tax=Prosopanche panguanensis TaxID=2952649 RepID=UPI002114A99D|nr:ribosomal protein S3 [Prosopanche panguanensis]USN93709.1 ribosomal protein S3 [Prosopanche panguanensis]
MTKINPISFRLNIRPNYYYFWFSNNPNYSITLGETNKIQDCFINYFKNKNINVNNVISNIRITKQNNIIKITFIILDFLNFKLLKIFNKDSNFRNQFINFKGLKFNIKVQRIKDPFKNPKVIAKYIFFHLKKGVTLKKLKEKVLYKIYNEKKIKGIKVKISGRTSGKAIGHKNKTWIKEGILPLQTIKENIRFCSYSVQTNNGLLGIKIWIYL